MKTAPILDQETFDRFLRSMATATREGRHLVEQLNRDGLLWTPDLEKATRAKAIAFILEELESFAPHEFLRRKNKGGSATPADMYMCIREWLQEHLAHARRKI
jgi:hypothetical protein